VGGGHIQGLERLMDTFCSIDPGALQKLDSKRALRFFGQLLWAQARKRGVPITKIHFSLRESVPDGGIDAAIDPNAFEGSDDVLVQGNTFYQVKTGVSAAPWQPSRVREELIGRKKRSITRRNLGTAVRDCLDRDGRYVLACFGVSLTTDRARKSRENFQRSFAKCGYPEARVEVWGAETLCGLFSLYPSLCLAVSGRDVGGFQPHASWAQNGDMTPPIALGDAQNQCIGEIREYLRGREVRYVRLIGEPGVGKTRLVLEATRTEDLAPCVLYVPHAEDFQKSPLFDALLHPDATYYVILVLDECSARDGAEIWNALKNRPQTCSIIGIDHDPSDAYDVSMREIPCPGLSPKEIAAILHGYVSSEFECSRWVGECGGSPRVAHVIGENLKANRGDLLRSPGTVAIWDRFVAGSSDLESPHVQRRLVVLRHLALFARFGFEEPVQDEAQYIAELTREVASTLTWGQFQSVVESLRKRRILQGKRTLFIAPRLLQIHLWREFWENYGRGTDLSQFFRQLPRGLRSWFIQMLPYAHTSEVATGAVKRFLGPVGVLCGARSDEFRDTCTYLSDLAQAAPEATLACIERIVTSTELARLVSLHGGNQEVVFALQRIAVWQDWFVRSATVLLEFAAATDNDRHTNAGAAFAEFFSLSYGVGAPTEAEPALRLPVLDVALGSPDRKRRELGLKACRCALSTHHLGAMAPAHQGLRRTANLWMPRTWRELFDSYAAVWGLLLNATRQWVLEDRRDANQILVESAPSLLFHHHLDDIVLTTLETLAEDEATDLQKLVHVIVACRGVWQEHVSDSAKERLAALDAHITGTTFATRLRRVLLLSSFHERFDGARESDEFPRRIGGLAQEALAHAELFDSVLPDLIKSGTREVYTFGFQLAARDMSRGLLRRIIDAHRAAARGASSQLLGGYLRQVYDLDPVEWQKVVNDLRSDPSLKAAAAELVFRSGFTKPVFQQLLGDYDAGEIDFAHLDLLTVTCVPGDLDEGDVSGLLARWDALAGQKSSEFPLRLLNRHYCTTGDARRLPEQTVFDVLRNDAVYADREFVGGIWARLVDQFLRRYPARALDVFGIIVAQVAKSHSRLLGTDADVQSVSARIIESDPERCWAVVAAILEDPRSPESGAIYDWLSPTVWGAEPDTGLLSTFPCEIVLTWIAEAPHTRAPCIAQLAPTSLQQRDKGTLTRELLVRYGDQTDVQSALFWRFRSGGWCGPASDHYRSRRDAARAWLANEEHPNVRRWLGNWIESLTESIEHAEIDEERGF
jgi:hypothetical protein